MSNQPTTDLGSPGAMGATSHEVTDVKASGLTIAFSTTFPEAELYKMFVQFQHAGEVLTTDLVLDVKDVASGQVPPPTDHRGH